MANSILNLTKIWHSLLTGDTMAFARILSIAACQTSHFSSDQKILGFSDGEGWTIRRRCGRLNQTRTLGHPVALAVKLNQLNPMAGHKKI